MNGPFYYRNGGVRIGPLSLGELKEHAALGRLGPDDLVWADGLEIPQPASRVEGLFGGPAAGGPPPGDRAKSDGLGRPSHGVVEPPPIPPAQSGNAVLHGNAVLQEGGKRVQAGLKVAGTELSRTATASLAQAKRAVHLGRTAFDARRLSEQALEAQVKLGERLNAAGQGDAALRWQLVQLAERRQSVTAAKGSTKLLDAERRGLHIRLAEPYLATSSPFGLEAEHQAAVALRNDVAGLDEQKAKERAELLPTDSGERKRVLIASGVGFLVVLFAIWLVFGRDGSSPEVVIKPTDDSQPVIQPIVTPPTEEESVDPETPQAEEVEKEDASKPTTKEQWFDADGYFPRRRTVATFVGDQPHGECKCYDDKDRLIAVEYYENGRLHGKRTSYYPSGKKFSQMDFKHGVATGTNPTWYENGNRAGEVDFVDGTLHGKNITYFPNGKKCVESQNVQGVPEGERYHYVPSGTHFGTTQWQGGQQVGQQILIDVGQADYQAIEARTNFSLLLKDHW